MKKILILFASFCFLFSSCRKDESKIIQNQKTEKETLKKVELLNLPKDFNQWNKEPKTIEDGKNPENIMIDNISYIKSYLSYCDSYSYEAELLPKDLEFIGTQIEVSISKNLFSILITSSHENYSVEIRKSETLEKMKNLFLTSGLFSVIDELKNYEMYYTKEKSTHIFKDSINQ